MRRDCQGHAVLHVDAIQDDLLDRRVVDFGHDFDVQACPVGNRTANPMPKADAPGLNGKNLDR